MVMDEQDRLSEDEATAVALSGVHKKRDGAQQQLVIMEEQSPEEQADGRSPAVTRPGHHLYNFSFNSH